MVIYGYFSLQKSAQQIDIEPLKTTIGLARLAALDFEVQCHQDFNEHIL